ncbi:phenylalanyl-tRNA synthetase alpha subunit, mitochondrial [Sorochytrium milnesiophthora]
MALGIQSSGTVSWMAKMMLAQFRQCRALNHTGSATRPPTALGGRTFAADGVSNVTPHIVSKVGRDLHRQHLHPINIMAQRIVHHFQHAVSPTFKDVNSLDPVVTPKQNFDDLLFPADHPGRSPSDTYYLNRDWLLRTHTSAHQSSLLAQNVTDFLVTADVYRRDEIDASHYPVFHQMEGFRSFSEHDLERAKAAAASAPRPSRTPALTHSATNPLQVCHRAEDVHIVAQDLKYGMESIVERLFRPADPDLQLRWVEGYFPFTSPSWELEILFRGKWLEVCGCGIVQQPILNAAGHNDKLSWAFGLGLERFAMILFSIPDIRLFWSTDERFLDQFASLNPLNSSSLTKFKPFSAFPGCYKDVAFWLPTPTVEQHKNSSGGTVPSLDSNSFHDNDLFDLVRGVAGDMVESVALVDQFTNPKTGRSSRCYRITYRSMDRNVTNEEINETQARVRELLPQKFNVELR